MTWTRRQLLKAGASAVALSAIPQPLLAFFGAGPEPIPPIQDPRIKELAFRAIDAARSAGAIYSDVRLTHTRTRRIHPSPRIEHIIDAEEIVVGVRALMDGFWGFASSSIWSIDEMARLAHEAVQQAKINAIGQSRSIELASTPGIREGRWVMPVEVDPFEVSPLEVVDYLSSLEHFVSRKSEFRVEGNRCEFQVQDKAFASSDGSYCTQRLYLSGGSFVIGLFENGRKVAEGALDMLSPAGIGWEIYKGQPLRAGIELLMEELKFYGKLPAKPVDVGRYETVCDSLTIARLAAQTLGRATELDRAIGYEVNAAGSSFLNDPLAMAGTYQIGAPLLTLHGNRTEHSGAATVKWDEEGVPTEEFTLVRDGVVTDFQTTRESAVWLEEYYSRQGVPVRSHGCAGAPSALVAPLVRPPNLIVAPGPEALDFDTAMAGIENGVAVMGLNIDMDFQLQNGFGAGGRIFEIKKGQRVARIIGAGVLFRTTELWKGLRALGGTESLRRYGMKSSKGEPPHEVTYSVTAPPAIFEQLTFIDALRRA